MKFQAAIILIFSMLILSAFADESGDADAVAQLQDTKKKLFEDKVVQGQTLCFSAMFQANLFRSPSTPEMLVDKLSADAVYLACQGYALFLNVTYTNKEAEKGYCRLNPGEKSKELLTNLERQLEATQPELKEVGPQIVATVKQYLSAFAQLQPVVCKPAFESPLKSGESIN